MIKEDPRILTSYFAKNGKCSLAFPISISRYTPRWLPDVSTYKKLAPSEELLLKFKSGGDEAHYTEQFNNYLKTLDAHRVVKELIAISEGKDVVLLCYETPDKFCHRHLVSAWLRSNGYSSYELV